MQRSACLIFNPVAGQGDPERDLTLIRSLLEPAIDLDIRLTSKEVGAEQLAQEAIQQGARLIIASGGDGTLSAAANALIGSNIPIGIISRGTANAFANALGIPDTIEAACETILTGTVKSVDAALCNGKPMVLLAGIGFEAETVSNANRQAKNRFGVLAYIIAGFKQLRNMKRFLAEIETEDRTINVSAIAVTIANAAPPTSILAQGPAGLVADDGLLDLTIVAPQNTAGAIAASYHLLQTALRGNAAEREDIGYVRAKQFKVTANPPQKVVLDGELLGTTPIEIKCIPGGLNIVVPVTTEEVLIEKLDGLPNLIVEQKNSARAE